MATIIAIKSVGIVMVSALLLIPAATAKLLAKNFRQMFPYAIITSLIATLGGILCSYFLNTPAGATIVVAATVIFFGTVIFNRLTSKH